MGRLFRRAAPNVRWLLGGCWRKQESSPGGRANRGSKRVQRGRCRPKRVGDARRRRTRPADLRHPRCRARRRPETRGPQRRTRRAEAPVARSETPDQEKGSATSAEPGFTRARAGRRRAGRGAARSVRPPWRVLRAGGLRRRGRRPASRQRAALGTSGPYASPRRPADRRGRSRSSVVAPEGGQTARSKGSESAAGARVPVAWRVQGTSARGVLGAGVQGQGPAPGFVLGGRRRAGFGPRPWVAAPAALPA